jgi:hypothetical protein
LSQSRAEYYRKYAEEHKEKIASYQRGYRQRNKLRLKAWQQGYLVNHRDEIVAKHKLYRSTPEGKAMLSRRNARQKGTLELLKTGICSFCGKEQFTHRHHYVPRRAGGSDTKENLVECCLSCHKQIEAETYIILAERLIEICGEEELRQYIKAKYGEWLHKQGIQHDEKGTETLKINSQVGDLAR